MTAANDIAFRALESAGVEFIDENGSGLGVRALKRQSDLVPILRKILPIAIPEAAYP